MKKHRAKNRDYKKIFNIGLLLISLGMLVYFCMADNNLATLLSSIPNLQIFWLITAVLCIAVVWGLDSFLLYTITRSVYPDSYPFKSAFKVAMVGQYFNAISPFAIAGQPMQLVAMSRQGISTGIALSVLVRKYLIYQVTLTVYSLAVILFRFQFFDSQIHGFMPLALVGFGAQAGIVLLLLLFSTNRKLTTKLIDGVFWLLSKLHIVKKPEETSEKVKTQLKFYLDNNKQMNHNLRMSLSLYGLTFLQMTVLFSVPFFIYKAFHNEGFPIFDMVSAQAFVTMIASYTPLPGASGTSEGSFLVLFDLFFHGQVIKQAMLLWRFITYYSSIIVGSAFAGLEKKADKMEVSFRTSEKDAASVQSKQAGTSSVNPSVPHVP